jgi:N-acetyl-anhydromuramyl-L-alanine amidase AmpD
MKKLYDNLTHVVSLNETSVGKLNPVGITLHYSAGGSVESCINALKQKKLGYHLIIDHNGDVYQFAEFDKKLNHAGNATWRGLSPNSNHVAVCLINWGILTKKDGKYINWVKSVIPENEVRERDGVYYQIASPEQEAALERFLKWAIVEQKIDPRNICGHDEAAIPFGRKSDPGGMLALATKEIRTLLQLLFDKK